MHKAVDINPAMGGRLMTDESPEGPGLNNYLIKRDWRRERGSEIRAEGYDKHWPSLREPHETDPGYQPYPGKEFGDSSAITLIHQAERGDGARALIVGTQQNLYLFSAETDGVYVDGVYQAGTFDADAATWTQIGTGFSANGHRWQAVNVNGKAFFNNQVDLPVSFRVGDTEVEPVYELRECGYARVGAIGSYNDILVTGDITEIQGDVFEEWMRAFGLWDSGAIIATQAANTVTACGEMFDLPDDLPADADWQALTASGWWVGRGIEWPDGSSTKVTAISGDALTATVVTAITVAAPGQAFKIKTYASQTGAAMAAATGTVVPGVPTPTTSRLTATAAVFTAADVGKRVHLANGWNSTIDALVGGDPTTQVNLHELAPETFTALSFWVVSNRDFDNDGNPDPPATGWVAQAGWASVGGNDVVLAPLPGVFVPGDVGRKIHLDDGVNTYTGTITAFVDAHEVYVSPVAAPGVGITPTWYLGDATSSDPPWGDWTDYTVTSTAPLFTQDMVGRTITWEDGTTRRIMYVVDPNTALVDEFLAIAEGFATVDNPNQYAEYTESHINRIQYRIEWSALGDGRSHAPSHTGSIDAASNLLRLDYPVKSLEIGDNITISGAGAAGGTFSANILFIAGNQIITLDDFAVTTVTSATCKLTSEVNSIAGYEDPAGDFSQVVGILELGGLLLIHKDRAIVVAAFTGDTLAPFQFAYRGIPNEKSLYYRHTLIKVGEVAHVWAGRSSFYRLDLSLQVPVELEVMEWCKSIFFQSATIDAMDAIFAADNSLTKEIYFVPSQDEYVDDHLLAFDYQFGTARTSSMLITAAATVKRPLSSSTVTDDWFLMGTSAGELLLYGKTNEPVQAWGNEKQIFYRRQEYGSTDKLGYESVIQTGLSDFGSSTKEKHVDFAQALIGNTTPFADHIMDFQLYGARNGVEGATLLWEHRMDPPDEECAVHTHNSENYFGLGFVVPATDSEGNQITEATFSLESWSISGEGLDTRSWSRSIRV